MLAPAAAYFVYPIEREAAQDYKAELCQKNEHSNGLAAIGGWANRLPLKQKNLCARRCTISAKENMGPPPLNKPSPSVCPKHAGQV